MLCDLLKRRSKKGRVDSMAEHAVLLIDERDRLRLGECLRPYVQQRGAILA